MGSEATEGLQSHYKDTGSSAGRDGTASEALKRRGDSSALDAEPGVGLRGQGENQGDSREAMVAVLVRADGSGQGGGSG